MHMASSSNMTSNSSDNPTDSSVSDSPHCLFKKDVYDVYCLIPAITIITVFAILKKRVKIKPNICNGRPGLVLPINFLGDSTNNRLSIAVAFGVIAGNCIDLFSDIAGLDISSFSVVKLHGIGPWEKAVNTIILVLLYGIINFPIFACLMTEHVLVGAVLGFLYTMMKFIALFVLLLSCPGEYSKDVQDGVLNQGYLESELYESIPGLLCHIFLLGRFCHLLFNEVLRRCWRARVGENEDASLVLAKEHDMIHVRRLLNIKSQSNIQRFENRNRFIRLRDRIYKARPDFKFSTEMISTLSVVVILIYQITVYLIMAGAQLKERVGKKTKGQDIFEDIFSKVSDILSASFYLSTFFTSIFSVLMMLHFMKCHRRHVLLSYKTRDFLGNSPSRLVGRSLSYPGYQIAYVGWGYIIMSGILVIMSFIVGIIIRYVSWATLSGYIKSFLPVFVVPVCVWIFQYSLGWLVFRDRQFPDITIGVNNRRLYCVISFFFFFFNILVGFFSSIFRLLKSMFLGVIFLSRIDRTPMMLGYHQWDQGYMSYIGFLNVLKSFSHPVMLVFCHHLVDLHKADSFHSRQNVFLIDTMNLPVNTCESEAHGRRNSYSKSRTAVNRWLVAYTLLKNPELRQTRKRNMNLFRI